MVVAMSMTVAIAAIVVAESEIECDRRADVGRITIAVARVIGGIVGRGIRRPVDSTSTDAAGNQ